MRFAVASDDAATVAAHTGRCRGFVIFDIADGQAARVEHRDNTFTAHARGECNGDHETPGESGHHSHGPLLDALTDCQALVTRGLGPRLVADLSARGIQAYVCGVDKVDEAAALFVQNRLPRADARSCGCHHS